MKQPEFFTTERDGLLALWVDWGEGPHNICDIPLNMESNERFFRAIKVAFWRGQEMQYNFQKKVPRPSYPLDTAPHYNEKGNYICWPRRKNT